MKGTKESLPRVHATVPMMDLDPSDLGLVFVKKMKNPFLNLRIQLDCFVKEMHQQFHSDYITHNCIIWC